MNMIQRTTIEAHMGHAGPPGTMDALSRVVYGAADNATTLLTVILRNARSITADLSIAQAHKEALGEIITAAQRAEDLTRQLVQISHQEPLVTSPLDVNGLISEMIGMLAGLTGGHIEIVLDLSPTASAALANRAQLEQVVMNLVVNARDAMPAGGSVTIATSDVELDDSPFQQEAIKPGHYVLLAVTDTGSGMTTETHRRLFEPASTGRTNGHGAHPGLPTAYDIIKQSHGYLWVDTEPGRGTTFKVYLPRAIASAVPKRAPEGSLDLDA